MPTLTHDELVTLSTLILAAPLLTLLLAGPSMMRRKTSALRVAWLGWTTRLFSGVSLACSILVTMGPPDEFPLVFEFGVLDFYLDALSVYFVLLVNLVAFFASWYTVDFLKHDARYGQHHAPEVFHFFFNAFHLTMLVVPMVDNLVILWMAIELTTLASTLLVRYRRRRRTLEASWKYISITTAGIVFALFGTILLTDAISADTCSRIAQTLGQGGKTCDQFGIDLLHWSLLTQPDVAQSLDPKLVTLSFLFVFVGYGTKAGFAPMHTWLPDGHGEAPSPVSALLSGVLLKSALYAILRFYTITNLNQGNEIFTSNVLLLSGLLSLVLATPFILKRNKFKRVLAYHSLEHMGIIVFGIGIGGPVALFGALLHALNHALTKALMFLTFSHVRHEHARLQARDEPDEEQLTGVLKSMPHSGTLLLLGGLGLVGSPPFNIFFSEFIILWAALGRIVRPSAGGGQLSSGAYILAVTLFLLTVTLIFGGLVGHLARLLLDRSPSSPGPIELQDRLGQLAPLLLLLFIIALFGVWIPTTPIDFPRLLKQSVHVLQYGAGGSR
jgi:hydrogenase-4 component F